jgi:TM2 domain-containing membrane protein YozV
MRIKNPPHRNRGMSSDPLETKVMEITKGRMPISTNVGAATALAPTNMQMPNPDNPAEPMFTSPGKYVPRPDRNINTTLLFSIVGGIIGLDHFYVRSHTTGILKMITAGGFLLWWIWDILQLWLERDRVLMYGMTTPFDMSTGIAQGMFVNGDTHYSQRSSFSLWLLLIVFGFLGLDLLMMGQVGQAVNIFISFLIAQFNINKHVINGSNDFGDIFWGGIGLFAGFGVAVYYLIKLYRVFFEPEKLMAKGVNGGLPIPSSVEQLLNWSRSITDKLHNGDEIRRTWMINPINSDQLRKSFWIAHPEEPNPPKDLPPDPWLPSGLSVGSALGHYYVIDPIEDGIMWIINKFTPMGRLNSAVDAVASGDLTKLESMVPGGGKLMKGITAGIEKADAAQEKVQGIMDKGLSAINTIQNTVERGTDTIQQIAATGQELSDIGVKAADTLVQSGKRLTDPAQYADHLRSMVPVQYTQHVNDLQKRLSTVANIHNDLKSKITEYPAIAETTKQLANHAAQLKNQLAIAKSVLPVKMKQEGGGGLPKGEGLSTESLALGATLIALIAGGAVKGLVNYLVPA